MRHFTNLFARVLLVSALAGCTTWRPQGLTPQAVIARDHPTMVRVTRQDSTKLVLDSPKIQGDSIRGLALGKESAVALHDVAYVSLIRSNNAGPAAVVGLGVVAGLITLLAATWN